MEFRPGFVTVITGAASGIGYGLAEAAIARGGRVVLSDVRADALEDAVARLRAGGASVAGVVADVADAESMRGLAQGTLELFGRVDVVCNNAGLVSPAARLWEQSIETWSRLIGVKVLGVVNGVTAFAPILVEQGSGHILNTASSGGLAPLPTRTPYTTTMHAVVGLTESLDLELKESSPLLGATVLCPGLVDTPLGQNSAALGFIEVPANATLDMRSLGIPLLSARDAAEAAFDGMEQGRVHVAPGHGVLDRARARVAALLADLESVEAC